MTHGRSYWNAQAGTYDLAMLVFGGPIPRVRELITRSLSGTGEVLEVAAGTGQFTSAICAAARSVVATDYAPEMVERLRFKTRTLRNVVCEQADATDLPHAAGRFDAVVACNVLHLLPDLPAALGSMRRVLRPGGALLLPTYCHGQDRVASFVSRALSLTGFPGQRRYSAEGLRAELLAHGLSVDELELVPGLLPMAFVRASQGPVERR